MTENRVLWVLDGVGETMRRLRRADSRAPETRILAASREAILNLLVLYADELNVRRMRRGRGEIDSPGSSAPSKFGLGRRSSALADDRGAHLARVIGEEKTLIERSRTTVWWSICLMALAGSMLALSVLKNRWFIEVAIDLAYCGPVMIVLGAPLYLWRAIRDRRGAQKRLAILSSGLA